MPFIIAAVSHSNRGGPFQAYGLRAAPGLLSPFMGVDHYWMNAPTFAPHRHAGMCAVSYLFLDSQTGMANRDSIGTQNVIQPGGLHWTTAGIGVTHEEVPAETGRTVHGLQIFIDLAPSKRDIPPFPLILEAQDVPVLDVAGARVRVPLGSYRGIRSPIVPPTEVTMLDIALEKGAEIAVSIPAGHMLFTLPVEGTFAVADHRFNRDDLKVPVFTAQDTEHEITLRAPLSSVDVMLFSGPPLPVA